MNQTIFILFLAGLLFSCTRQLPPADLIITNTTIWTGDENNPSAQAMAIAGDTLVAVGTTEAILKYKGASTKVLDLQGTFVTPGFIDCHVHFFEGGFNLSSVQLRDARTPQEFISRIKAFAATQPEGTWILGGDWDHENWGGELPTRHWIDSITPHHPVFVTRLDGHMSLANSVALHAAKIVNTVKDVPGGTIVRDSKGQLTGILKDNAADLIYPHIPEPTPQQTDNALEAAMHHVASKGVTSVHHMVGYMDALERAHQNNNLITRIYAMYPLSQWQQLSEKVKQQGRGDDWLKIGGLKGFVDGSLGSHTAAFFEPFTDAPTDNGLWVNTPEQLYHWISHADKAGLQLMVHAIGDRAINSLLNIYERVEKENGVKDRRFRIEHAQHIAPADIPRFAHLNVIASMQPYHAVDDGRWAEKVIGAERSKTSYAFKSLFDAGATVAFGSDWFVAPPTPLEGIYAAVTRRTLDGLNPEGWVPKQKITVAQALVAYTRNAAYASFDEHRKGTLITGKLADFVVLDKNPFAIAPEQIKDIRVMQTYVGGKPVFTRPK
ncbi:MAG: amidohydrolase [Cyclobacteriaceae bacterium]|nr:amidohydrolase [Cyclobacteriaceae bacterium]UYN85242.1 MAG: amidohydrolase [Cyclobacteriaceae bacterium]